MRSEITICSFNCVALYLSPSHIFLYRSWTKKDNFCLNNRPSFLIVQVSVCYTKCLLCSLRVNCTHLLDRSWARNDNICSIKGVPLLTGISISLGNKRVRIPLGLLVVYYCVPLWVLFWTDQKQKDNICAMKMLLVINKSVPILA